MSSLLLRAEGLRGMYRGFGLSVMTFVPSSALWWGCYGGYQKLLWQQLDDLLGGDGTSSGDILSRPTHQVRRREKTDEYSD
jgi:solute carrier family 25 protein 44